MQLTDVLTRLQGVKKSGSGYMAQCPAHDDQTASLSIKEGEAGRVLLHCHAGCTYDGVVEALGLYVSDLMGEDECEPLHPQKRIVATYDYTDENGTLLFQKVRYEPKTFTIRRPDGLGRWEYNRKGVKLVPYNLRVLLASDSVFLVEGEQDVESLRKMGLAATCSPDGAGSGKFKTEMVNHFTNKSIYIIPDNDAVGKAFAQDEADILSPVAKSVKVLDLLALYPELSEHGDITDVVHALGAEVTKQALRELVKATPEYNEQDGRDRVDNPTQGTAAKPLIISAADVRSAPIPWLIQNFLARRGVNSVQGLPDSGKTYFTLNLAATVAGGGVFPNDAGEMERIEAGRVLYANFDDSLEYTVKPRLESMGVTDEAFKNIFFIPSDSGLTFQDPRLNKIFEDQKPDLAIFDTLQHFIGANVDLNRANETNAALINLKNLCEQYNTAAVVVQHISKQGSNGNGGASVCWGIGSMAINGLFRSVWTLGKVIKEGAPPYRRALAPTKTNLLPCTPPARLYDLDPQRGFMWAGVDAEITAQDLRNGDKKAAHRPDNERREAEDVIHSILINGEVESAELENRAAQAGISRATYKRARENLGVKAVKRGNKWYSVLSEEVKSIKTTVFSTSDTLETVNSVKPLYINGFGNLGSENEQARFNTFDTLAPEAENDRLSLDDDF